MEFVDEMAWTKIIELRMNEREEAYPLTVLSY
jgi:hypothetical protein